MSYFVSTLSDEEVAAIEANAKAASDFVAVVCPAIAAVQPVQPTQQVSLQADGVALVMVAPIAVPIAPPKIAPPSRIIMPGSAKGPPKAAMEGPVMAMVRLVVPRLSLTPEALAKVHAMELGRGPGDPGDEHGDEHEDHPSDVVIQ